jgi:hypothetical protein
MSPWENRDPPRIGDTDGDVAANTRRLVVPSLRMVDAPKRRNLRANCHRLASRLLDEIRLDVIASDSKAKRRLCGAVSGTRSLRT